MCIRDRWKIWGISDDVLCAGNDETLKFIDDVLGEIIEIFPSEYIHVGGDECPKVRWKTCPKCQARIKALGIKGDKKHSAEAYLQSFIITHAEKFLNDKGRQIIGWDEILEGGLAPNSTVMSWRGESGGIEAAKQHHDVIMSPNTYLYFDYYQSKDVENEPEAIGGYLPIERVYSYEPMPKSLTPEEQKYIKGVQANLWTEYIPTFSQVEYMELPRMAALAEVQWTMPAKKNYEDFHVRALKAVEELKKSGYNPFELKNEIGNRPGADKPVEHLAVGKKVTYGLDAAYYPGYAAGGDTALVDGVRGGWTYGDKRWQGFIDKKRMDITIDLEKETELHFIGADFMQVCGPEVFMPAEVIISISDDGKDFTELKHIEHKVVKDDKVTFTNFGWEGNAKGRYVRYQATSGEVGGFLFTDEVVIK